MISISPRVQKSTPTAWAFSRVMSAGQEQCSSSFVASAPSEEGMADQDLRGIATPRSWAATRTTSCCSGFRRVGRRIGERPSVLDYSGHLWARGSFWLLAAALVMSAAAAAAGFADFLGSARIPSVSEAWQYMIANLVAVILALVSFAPRGKTVRGRSALGSTSVCRSRVPPSVFKLNGGALVYRQRSGIHPERARRESLARGLRRCETQCRHRQRTFRLM